MRELHFVPGEREDTEIVVTKFLPSKFVILGRDPGAPCPRTASCCVGTD